MTWQCVVNDIFLQQMIEKLFGFPNDEWELCKQKKTLTQSYQNYNYQLPIPNITFIQPDWLFDRHMKMRYID